MTSPKGSDPSNPVDEEDAIFYGHRAILYLRIGIILILCCLIGGLGGGSYVILYQDQMSSFHNQFISLSDKISSGVETELNNMIEGLSLANSIYGVAIKNGYGGSPPNVTLPGFEHVMEHVMGMTEMRSLQFAPLIVSEQRHQWEAYAAAHVNNLDGPASLINGSWPVSKGIFSFASDHFTKVSASNNVVGARQHPDWLFPIWQAAPIASNADIIMLECHQETVSTVDQVIETMKPAVTAPFQLFQDGTNRRPSSILYAPVTSPLSADYGRLIGFVAAVLSWDLLFDDLLPSYFGQIYCVFTTATAQFTFTLDDDKVSFIGNGDLHDRKFDAFGEILKIPTLSDIAPDHSVVIYPSSALYSRYFTTVPRDACIVVVFVIVFTAVVVMLHSYYVHERMKILVNEVKTAEVVAASKEAALDAKKIFIRYISHEIRTPMNAAMMGIQLLEKRFRRAPEGLDKTSNLETLYDMRSAFDMAVTILNDLLNFDKMESGNFTIDPAEVDALPYISGCLKISSLQAREKDINLTLDLGDVRRNRSNATGVVASDEEKVSGCRNSDICDSALATSSSELPSAIIPKGDRACTDATRLQSHPLDCNDVLYIDKYKMDQVVRNLISNAIKFTPAGKNITVRARKHAGNVIPNRPLEHDPSAPGEEKKSNHSVSQSKKLKRIYQPIGIAEGDLETGFQNERRASETNLNSNSNSNPVDLYSACRAQSDTLVLEVIDEGAGIAPENIKKLFKEIVQFNPGKLQAGGGSGLGMMISKGIVDMHRGDLSVSSEGEGKGTTFTLMLPLYQKSPNSKRPSNNPSAYPSRTQSRNASNNASRDQSQKASKETSTKSKHPLHEASLNSISENDIILSDDLVQLPNAVNAVVSSQQSSSAAVSNTNPHESSVCDDLSQSQPHTTATTADMKPLTATTALPPAPPARTSSTQDITNIIGDITKITAVEVYQNADAAAPAVSTSTKKFLDVLVVDDSKINRRMLVRLLEADDHHCEEAEDGQKAVDMASTRSYDAILMDFVMPVMDGPTATKNLRDQGYRGVILGVTGNALSSDVTLFMDHGVNQVLIKPVDANTLRVALVKHGVLSDDDDDDNVDVDGIAEIRENVKGGEMKFR